jgi:signal transduction histidine kinase
LSSEQAKRPFHFRFPERTLPVAILATTLFFHAYAVFVKLMDRGPWASWYSLELVIDMSVSALFAIAAFFVRRATIFRLYFGIRFVLFLVAFRILARLSILPAIMLTSVFILETMVSDERKLALALSCAAILGFWLGIVTEAHERYLCVSYLAAVVPLCAFSYFSVHYRENLARMSTDLERSEETVKTLMTANMAFQLYANNVESESVERERNRITRELHDSIGYALTNVIVMMNAGKVLLKKKPEDLNDLFEKVGNQAEEALATTRQTLHLLRDIQSPEPIGLQAVACLVRNFKSATNVDAEVSFGNLGVSLGKNLDTILFRIVQEGLTNAFRHGRATRIRISMWHTESEILLTIRDNGRGLESDSALVEGIGFSGMRERLSAFGGTLIPRSVVDGFELGVVIPYHVRELND